MESNTKDCLEILFSGVTAISLVIAVIQIKINRKQLNLSVIEKCINDFRSIDGLSIETNKVVVVKKYIDLVNEELFYIQRGYLPLDISKEWVDGIIDYIPILDRQTKEILNRGNSFKLLNDDLNILDAYPRIRHTFSVSKSYDFSKIYNPQSEFLVERVKARKELINELLMNLKKFNIYD